LGKVKTQANVDFSVNYMRRREDKITACELDEDTRTHRLRLGRGDENGMRYDSLFSV
jgi:hypothetical protein